MLAAFTGDGEQAADNPWRAHTIEWATSSPAPPNNFVDVMTVTSAEPLFDDAAARSTGDAAPDSAAPSVAGPNEGGAG
jgi:heme/copper-type cytochrome/quinol oxidase subunit 1